MRMVCPSCSHANPAAAKFCSECGTRLNAVQGFKLEERKVVTVLFADLVGFTSRAEQMDPEDVRAFLSPYHARLRVELERFGGTVEKFIGDAVMALFGAPAAHEDDPERAVRAALAIREWVRAEEGIQVRIAVNTGEALIVLGERHLEGEGMAAGDVVNSAAFLQSSAPVNGVLVGERTFRATRQTIQYRQVEAVAAKGKSQPIPVWEALDATVEAGSHVGPGTRTPLVGRERELKLLRGGLVRLQGERSTQLITVVGVPGIGKSRLLDEMAGMIEVEAMPITCLQGRTRPYNSTMSLDALAEMLKTQSGILETDSPAEADEKLTRTTAEVLPDRVEWVRRHLSVLVGGSRPGDAPMRDGDQEEKFAAWRGFFEALAERQPLVLMFEDLHWADDGLLEFLDYLVEWATDVPLLVVCSARPELLERRPGWGGGKANAMTLSLSPLSDEDTASIIRLLACRPLVEANQSAELLARAGGNPLYAEQYVRMLADHRPDEELSPPASIHAIIAARLDALPPAEKQLLRNAAVIGRVFWPQAIDALSDGVGPMPQEHYLPVTQLEELLHRLERKQFVRRDRESSVAGQSQYAFLHILLREVAYGQIPRPARIDKHLRAAGWFEALGRPDDQAQMLAHHYLAALDLAGVAGEDVAGVAPRARVALRAAGDRAQALNGFDSAATFYRSALELWPEQAVAERTDLLFRLAVALFLADDDSCEEALESALAALLAAGNRTRAAVIESHLGDVSWLRGDRDRCFQHLFRAYELVRDEPASADKVDVLANKARHQMLADFDTESARQALELAEALGLDEQRAQLLITIGSARWFSGNRDGREDIRRGLEIALAGDYPQATWRAYVNLGGCAGQAGDLHEALRLSNEAGSVARRLGVRDELRWHQATAIELLFELGRWQECAVAADEFISDAAARRAKHYMDSWVRLTRARLRLARDDLHGALLDQSTGLSAARIAKDPQVLYPALTVSAYLLADAGRLEDAGQLVDEFMAKEPSAIGELLVGTIIDLAFAADRLGRTGELRQWLAGSGESLWSRAARALVDHDFQPGLALLEDIGAIRSLNVARLWAARVSFESGRTADVEESLNPALDFFHSVGAKRFVRRAEALSVSSRVPDAW